MKILSSLHLTSTYGAVFMLSIAVCGLSACTAKKKSPPPPAPTAEKKVEPAAEKKDKPAPLALGHRFPVGPQLVFLPGKGAGAIRFGATVETIERHMGAPCDKKSENRCLYVRSAVEFFLKDGVLDRIKAHRRDRGVSDPPASGDKFFGTLSGTVAPNIMLGLHRHVVLEEFGAPKKKEAVSPPGPFGLVDRHFYDGINFEYDTIENGNTVLSAIEIYPSETPYSPPVPPAKRAAPAGKSAKDRPELRAK